MRISDWSSDVCSSDRAVSLSVAAEVAKGTAVRHYVETSTIGANAARDIAATMKVYGIAMIDAAVSGGAPVARQGALVIMLAAPAKTVGAVRPVLARLAGAIFVIGEIGRAHVWTPVTNAHLVCRL